MIELKPLTGVFAVVIPYTVKNIERMGLGLVISDDHGNGIGLPIGFKFTILGTCTKDKIDFDCEPYVKSYEMKPSDNEGDNYLMYMDYVSKVENDCHTKEESFRSLLTASGVYFENPLGEEEPFVPFTIPYGMDEQLYDQEVGFAKMRLIDWQEAQSKVVDKVVIIKQTN